MPPKDLEVISILGNCSSYSDLAVTITGEKKGKGYAPRRKCLESGNEGRDCGSGRVGRMGRGPLLLLSVVASITVEIDSTRHQSEFIHWVGHLF